MINEGCALSFDENLGKFGNENGTSAHKRVPCQSVQTRTYVSAELFNLGTALPQFYG